MTAPQQTQRGREMTTLGEVAELKIGRTPARASGAYWTEGSTPWVSIADMANGPLRTTKESISPLALTECFGGRLVPAGTLLMSFKLTIGKVAILQMPAVHNEAIVSILPRPEVDRDYLFYYLQVADLLLEQDAYVKGKTLNREKLLRIPIWLPPLDEQQRIARILSTMQTAVETSEEELQHIHRLRRIVLADQLTPTDAWQQLPLAEVADTASGGTPRSDVPEYYGGQIPWVQSGEVVGGEIVTTQKHLTPQGLACSAARVFPAGTLLIAMYGATAGQVALLGIDAATNQAVCCVTPHRKVEARFLYYALEGARERLRAARVGAAQPNLSQQLIRSFVLGVPPLDEQRRIVRVLAAFDRTSETTLRRLGLLRVVFSSAMTQLLGGSA